MSLPKIPGPPFQMQRVHLGAWEVEFFTIPEEIPEAVAEEKPNMTGRRGLGYDISRGIEEIACGISRG